jgi:glycylpeptide N-tetradecanoyltransferase
MLNHLPPPHSQVEASHKRIAKPTLYQLEKKFSSIMAESQPVDGLDPAAESESEHEDGERAESHTKDAETTESTNAESAPAKKKKKSKKSKVAAALTGKKDSTPDPPKPAGSKMTPDMMNTLLEMNPSLKGELSSMNKQQASELLKKMDVSELLTGLSLGPKNQKDIASYKFWQTQPVPKFEEDKSEEGPIKPVIPEMVPKNPAPLPEAYEWCELDLTNDDEIAEVYNLLTYHYVEDDNAQFRFNYSKSFLDWALKSPGWKRSWHIGVRASKSRKLVATIFGIPTSLRVRSHVLSVVEINFLCVHKQLRSKRLAPTLIKEVTRRCHLEGIYQAIYTAGVVLPTPVGSCRYFHRPLDWLKLFECGFSGLPPSTTKARMVSRHQLPVHTSTPDLRPMTAADIDSVLDLLSRYLKRFDLAQEFTREEVEHWLFNKIMDQDDRVVWAYVVEGEKGKITDLVSFYCLESSVIKKEKHDKVRAAYLFYYASEMAFNDKEKGLKERLRSLVSDALVEAKKVQFEFSLGWNGSRELVC